MIALKAQWAVYCGMILGQDMEDRTRAFTYTSVDYAADGNHRGVRFLKLREQAHLYAIGLEAQGMNFTRIEYIWM